MLSATESSPYVIDVYVLCSAMAVLTSACIACIILALYVKHLQRKRQDLPRCQNSYADVENTNQIYDAIEQDLCTASASDPKDDEMSSYYVDMFGVQVAPLYQEEPAELDTTKDILPSFDKDSNCKNTPNSELCHQNISSQDCANDDTCGEHYQSK